MSKPKKPGTDLAALKARLAKKTKGADAPAPEAAAPPMPDVPAPGQVAPAAPAPDIPAPGQVMPPGQAVPAPGEIPAPGQVAAPMADVPPPGQPMADVPPPGMPVAAPEPAPQQQYVAQAPMPQAAPVAPPPANDDDPFGGTTGGAFDPDAGLLDGGPEIAQRGSKGLVLFAALLAAGIGAVGGWLGHKIISTQEKIEIGKVKGAKMVQQVEAISEARKSVSLAMEDLKKSIAQNPASAADEVTALMTKNFDKQPQVSELFGWQLAAVHTNGIKATFSLYEEVNSLQSNLRLLSGILRSYGPIMKVAGPSLYGLTFGPSGGQLVVIDKMLCGEAVDTPEAIAALKPCDAANNSKAVAYEINDFGGQPKRVVRGAGEGQAMMLLPEGKVYQYAIGLEPGNNAEEFYKMVIKRVDENLAEMDKSEEKAKSALKNYADSPNVDGSSPQPDPGGGEG